MFWRVLAAAVGGYLLASLLPIPLVAPWPLARADAVITAMMASFAVYTAAIMAAFASRTALRQSMAALHTWMGLLFGWLLYFMFVTGTAGYLDTEIDRWMRPELPPAVYPLAAEGVARTGIAYLEANAPGARRWTITIPTDRNDPYLRVTWRGANGNGAAFLDPATGEPLAARETGGGQALYRMHWVLHYMPVAAAEGIVGIATMFMLVAIVTGIVVHRRIFADFFTFRPRKGQRSWLDAHNLASVVSLPYQIMITWSGLIFVMFSYMPLIIAAWYGPGGLDGRAFLEEVFPSPARAAATGKPVPMVSPGAVLADARPRLAGAAVTLLEIDNPGDAAARITVVGDFAQGPLRAADLLTYDGASGELLSTRARWLSGPKAFRDLMLGLHEGLFAGPALRALYLLAGLLGTAMVGTGLVLWSVKRRQRVEKERARAHAGLRLVEKLNVGTIIGLPVAIATYFWANRLLPVDLPRRGAWELDALFMAWLAMMAHAAVRPVARGWFEQSLLAALAFGLLPVLNAFTSARHLGVTLGQGDWVMAGFDLSMLGIGAAFLWLALHLRKRKHAPC
ncbi:MAG: PepSY-associated TM helix domain-containing protein [Burkholderiaceae bacterium]